MNKHQATANQFLILFVASMSITLIPLVPSALADPFGIFNYDNPSIVNLQGLRAHLFEVHDATHKANSSAIIMHINMADEEISHFLKNLTAGKLPEIQNSNLSDILGNVQIQLDNVSSNAKTGNMTGIMSILVQADDQLAKPVEEMGYVDASNSTTK